MKKKILACILAVSMVFSVAACGDNSQKTNTETNNKKDTSALSKQGVFKIQEMKLESTRPEEEISIQDTKMVGDTIYMVTYSTFKNGSAFDFITTDKTGKILTRHNLMESIWEVPDDIATDDVVARTASSTVIVEPAVTEPSGEDDVDTYTDIYIYEILEDGKLAYVETTETYNFKTYESTSVNVLVICTADGTEQCRVDMTEVIPEDIYFWPNGMVVGENNTMFVTSYEVILAVDLNNNEVKAIETTEVTADLGAAAFYKDGVPVFTKWNDDWTERTYNIIDFEKGEIVETIEIPINLERYSIYDAGNSGYDLILNDNSGVYGYNFGDQEPTLLMDYVNSDLPSYNVNSITFLDEEHFIAMYSEFVTYDRHTAIFSKVAPEDVPDKAELVLAVYGKGSDLSKSIIDFNLSNDQYRIVVKDYAQYAATDDYFAGIGRLDSDIISGNVPDIIQYNSELQLSKYASKGLLVDAYELFEKDSDINLEDYCENVFRAYETDGKLYQIPIGFYVSTVYGKSSIFGDKTSITWEELNNIMAQYPESSMFGDMRTRTDMLYTAIIYSYSKLINDETGECHFNSDVFKEILEFVKQFPEEIDWESRYADEDYWEKYSSQYIEDRTLLYFATIYNMRSLWEDGIGTFAEAVTPVGFPIDEGVGSYLTATDSYAISAKSKNQEGAWQFVKSLLSEEAQVIDEADYYSWGLPVLKTALEKCVDSMTHKPYYIDYEGNKQEYDYSVWINDQEVIVDPATKEQAQGYYDFILSIDKTGSLEYEGDIMAIITEEAAPYFNDQKTIDAVADVIQSRISILISESR